MDAATQAKMDRIAKAFDLVEDMLAEDGRFPLVEQKIAVVCEALGYSEDGKLTVDLKSVVEEVDRLKAAQQAMTERIRMARTPLYVPGLGEEAEKFSVVRALVAHHSRNWSKAGFEKEALDAVREKAGSIIAGDDEQAGLFIPDQVIPDWIPAIYTRSNLISLDGEGQTRVTVLSGLTGVPAKIPEFKGGMSAYWVGEADPVTKSKTKTGSLSLTPKKLAAAFSMTEEARENAVAMDPFIRREVTRRIAMELDRAGFYGTGGNNMILGICNTDGITIYRAETGNAYDSMSAARGVADWQGGELTPDKLEEMKLEMEERDLDADETFHTAMSPRYKHRLKTTKVDHYLNQAANSDYLFAPFFSDAALTDLIGSNFTSNHIKSNKLPGASIGGATTSTDEKFTDVLRGNFGEVLVGIWGGMRFKDDGGEGTDFLTEEINFMARMRVDMQVRRKSALVLCPDARAKA